MGDNHYKIDGLWVGVQRPYVKVANNWSPVKASYVKRDGVWQGNWQYDVTPPPAPLIDIQAINNEVDYLRVGIALPGPHDPELKMIRAIVREASTWSQSPFDAGYYDSPDASYPFERFGDWFYNGANASGNHPDSSVMVYKTWPPGSGAGTKISDNRYFYVSAWAQDMEGNWSQGAYNRIWVPKRYVKPAPINKGMVFAASSGGTLDGGSGALNYGQLIVNESPRSNGVYFHGGAFNHHIGLDGPPVVTNATIRIHRNNDDGLPTANVKLFWHEQAAGNVAPHLQNDETFIGTINRGEAKLFTIPQKWWHLFDGRIKGFGLKWGTGRNNYMKSPPIGNAPRNGEVTVHWTEHPV